MEKEELKELEETFVKLCDYWFGKYRYSKRFDQETDNTFYSQALGYCSHTGEEFGVDEEFRAHDFCINFEYDGPYLTVSYHENCSSDYLSVEEFVRSGIQLFFVIKKIEGDDKFCRYKIISINYNLWKKKN